MDRQKCVSKLQKAIMSILNYVNSKNGVIKTVAIPALSSGIFQFPLDLCTQVIVETIKSYYQRMQPGSNLREIHLVSNEDPTVAAFKAASEVTLGKNELGLRVTQEASTIVLNNMTLQIVQGLIELQDVSLRFILLHCQRGSLNCLLLIKCTLSIYYFKHCFKKHFVKVKSMDFRARPSGFQYWLCHLLTG